MASPPPWVTALAVEALVTCPSRSTELPFTTVLTDEGGPPAALSLMRMPFWRLVVVEAVD